MLIAMPVVEARDIFALLGHLSSEFVGFAKHVGLT